MKQILNYFKRCRIPTKQEIDEYYPKYLKAHRSVGNKICHFVGNILTWSFIIFISFLSINVTLLFGIMFIASPFIVYIGAWPGHKFFEKNQPATFKQNPILTKICDNIMMYQLISGKLKWKKSEQQKVPK